MSKRFPTKPTHPERVCWGCDRYCSADSLICGNDTERTQHPAELFGDDWFDFGLDVQATGSAEARVQQPAATAVTSTPFHPV